MRPAVLCVLLAACGTAQPAAVEPPRRQDPQNQETDPGGSGGLAVQEGPRTPIADQYREVAGKIIAAAEADQGAWEKLRYLTDRIGNRISGSRSLEQAVEWALAAMKADGHEEVRAEKVMVPHWVRGAESAALVAPVERRLALIGLGGTVATPPGGLVADVVVLRDFAELDALGAQVKGKIVLFDVAMPAYTEEKGSGYGETVEYRTHGPARAAALGASAVLIRSVTARSLRSPHTGTTLYEEGKKRIPAAALSVEDAELIGRLAASGEPVRIKLVLSGRHLPDAASANVLAELRGREKPDEVVVIGAHLDSWDVGAGAHDDGAGVAIVMEALTVLRRLGLTPRRTIRVVLFTNEENGLRGAKQYAADHAAELARHVMGLETDSGGFHPRGFEVQGSEQAVRQVADIASLLEPIGATRTKAGHAGSDVGIMESAGVPLLGLSVEGSRYFDYHHSEADTLDKVDPRDLARDVAAVAVVSYVAADMPEPLAR